MNAFARLTAAAAFLLLCAAGLAAQQSGPAALSRWLNGESHAAYRSVEGKLVPLFTEAERLGIPEELLINRMNLGAARRITPSGLAAGMQREMANLSRAAELIGNVSRDAAGRALLAQSRRAELLNTISIYLAGGISPDLMDSFLSHAAKTGRSLEETFMACHVMLRVEQAGGYAGRELLDFGVALMESAVRPSSYGAIGSFVLRYAASGRGDLLQTVTRILRQGGGLPQMELELGRRR